MEICGIGQIPQSFGRIVGSTRKLGKVIRYLNVFYTVSQCYAGTTSLCELSSGIFSVLSDIYGWGFLKKLRF